MAIRIKSKWSKTVKRKKTPEDYGSALSFISWRLSLDKAKTLHGEDFEYENDHQRVSIIVEYMSFQVHLVDRLLFEDNIDGEFRAQVMNSLGKQSARIMQENCEDLFGPGDYKKGYINTLNLRSTEYSEFEFSRNGSNYSLYRHLSKKCQDVMGYSQTNKWVMDQIIDIDSVEILKKILGVYDSVTKT